MQIRHLWLTDFRSWPQVDLEAVSGTTVLRGPNGVGKTNLLEALDTFQQLGDKKSEAQARNRLGRLYRELNEDENALPQLDIPRRAFSMRARRHHRKVPFTMWNMRMHLDTVILLQRLVFGCFPC